jgi:ectoine hydroxylase-related dioxygenase (phytanoyl-CoA dioxygenase family)
MIYLQEQGFEIIPDVASQETVDTLCESLAKVSTSRGRAGMRNALRVPAVQALANDEKLVSFARNVLGERATAFRATLFDKSQGSNWLVVWHQDTALPLRERRDVTGWGPWSVKEDVICAHAPASALEQVLAIRVHLDDSNEGTGSLRVLPRSHMAGVLTDDAIHDLASKIPPVNCDMETGGILLMRPLIVHASSKINIARARRRVLHIEYAASRNFPGGLELDIC